MPESKEARRERQALELWTFVNCLRTAGNIVFEEFRFDPERKWRIDVAIPNCSVTIDRSPTSSVSIGEPIAIEIEGFGRHQSMVGFKNDIEKYGELFARGWSLLRVTREMIANGDALELLARRGVQVEGK